MNSTANGILGRVADYTLGHVCTFARTPAGGEPTLWSILLSLVCLCEENGCVTLQAWIDVILSLE